MGIKRYILKPFKMPEDVKTPEELSQLKFQLKNEKLRCVEIASKFGFKGDVTCCIWLVGFFAN